MEYYLNPQEFFKKTKGNKDIFGSLVYLLAGSLLFCIGTAVNSGSPFLEALFSTANIILFLLLFFGGVFLSYLFHLTFVSLGGKGKFMHGLTTVGYSTLMASVGFFLFSIFIYVANFLETGSFLTGLFLILSVASMAVFGVIAYASLYVGSKELFGVDMLTAFVGVSIITGILFVIAWMGMISFTGNMASVSSASPYVADIPPPPVD